MQTFSKKHSKQIVSLLLLYIPAFLQAQTDKDKGFFPNVSLGEATIVLLVSIPTLLFLLYLSFKLKKVTNNHFRQKKEDKAKRLQKYLTTLSMDEIQVVRRARETSGSNRGDLSSNIRKSLLLSSLSCLLHPWQLYAQSNDTPTRERLSSEPGVLIAVVLILIPLFFAVIFLGIKANNYLKKIRYKEKEEEAQDLARFIMENPKAIDEISTSGNFTDEKGLISNIKTADEASTFFAKKQEPVKRPKIDPALTKLILAFLGSAIFWLVIATSVGEYVGIKFVMPDADTISWLSFGRLRPVHTNLVFWAWTSLAMLGLGYYVVPRVGNNPLASIRHGWYSLIFINAAHVFGVPALMAGINNGGGEFREYTWPIMTLFVIGLAYSLINFLRTIARRKTKEIYISNWYISSAIVFIPIIVVLAYLPFYQDGIGETVMQGYYMHQAIGMWFMQFTLGLLYYFLPQQLNKPIYSYSLGILAFWAQILFYTLIGTHHFVFSALPWWLQTTAIVGSVGMLIPVTAGTVNFLMTFKGSWSKVARSYSLPFFLVGVIYYFLGSFQGTTQAWRVSNILWHFTDYTVAHAHATMYGIITFILFGGIYAIVPRITGKEPNQLLVGAHFWLAFIGLLIYTMPLSLGATLKGLSWAEGKAFIDSVVLMGPYWLWRAIGGSLMWLSHLVLGYNFYKMLSGKKEIDIKERAFEILKSQAVSLKTN
jgi:cytochrome c oxidase cbb3-type subunit I